GLKLLSYASTLPDLKLVAYRYVWPSDAWASARPLYTALAPLSRATSVTVAPTVGFQPSIVPFSVSKMNSDEAECPWPSLTANPEESELTPAPVGAAPVMSTVGGTLVTDSGVEPAAYSVVLSEPLSATHIGEPGAASVPGDAASPHALTR